jgi:hypothetical protein
MSSIFLLGEARPFGEDTASPTPTANLEKAPAAKGLPGFGKLNLTESKAVTKRVKKKGAELEDR